MNKNQPTVVDNIIEVSLFFLILAEPAHLFALLFHQPFHICAAIMAVLFVCTALLLITFSVVKHKNVEKTGTKTERRFLKLLKMYPCLVVVTLILILLQIIWYFWMHLPYLQGDITVETVQSILATDSLYTVNPMTGQAFSEGMPFRLQILVLPSIYAAICYWTGIPAQVLVYSVIPVLTLILSYLIFTRFAVYLFPGEGRKQVLFVLFATLVYQFGCYSVAMDSYHLFFGGYQGVAIRVGVVLPYALICCLQKRPRGVLLCILVEACIVWTLYGFGYTVIEVLVFLVMKGLTFVINKRESAR